jgi:hypothetical protein
MLTLVISLRDAVATRLTAGDYDLKAVAVLWVVFMLAVGYGMIERRS